MKYNIMTDILLQLLSRKKLTAKQIAEKHGISTRSVYRYVEELNVCGVPVDVIRGRYGGLTIPDTFRLPSGYFTREEYASTVNALTAMASQVADDSIISALEKLQVQQKDEKLDLSVCGNIIVDGGTWGDSKKFSDKMRVCESAVNDRESILIDYISRGGEHSRRIIDPYVLIYKQNVWYVYAFCHTKQTFRTFKIGRIKNATFTGRTFQRQEINRDDIQLNFYRTPDALIEVTLEIQKNSLADAEEWLGIDNIEPHGDSFIARMTLPSNGLVNKILGYGGAVKVLEPEHLKKQVTSAAKRIAEMDD